MCELTICFSANLQPYKPQQDVTGFSLFFCHKCYFSFILLSKAFVLAYYCELTGKKQDNLCPLLWWKTQKYRRNSSSSIYMIKFSCWIMQLSSLLRCTTWHFNSFLCVLFLTSYRCTVFVFLGMHECLVAHTGTSPHMRHMH